MGIILLDPTCSSILLSDLLTWSLGLPSQGYNEQLLYLKCLHSVIYMEGTILIEKIEYNLQNEFQHILRGRIFKSQNNYKHINSCWLYWILLNSFIQYIFNEDYHNPFMDFYCYTRMHNILDMKYSIHDASLTMTPYYEVIYGLIQNVLHMSVKIAMLKPTLQSLTGNNHGQHSTAQFLIPLKKR